VKERTLSVGTCDLTHFDRAMHELGVEKTLAILDRAFAAAGDAIVSNGGTILKYVGDAILFTFEDPRAAARAAEAVAKSFDHAEAGLEMRWHCAVVTGPVFEVTVGHASKRLPDVYGATVNDAFRLMKKAYASPTRFALCDRTTAAL
jgi:adenylate cyclase